MPLDPIAYKPYGDPDEFIREVTDLIWVDRAIGYIRENYEPDSIVHGAYGTSVTRNEVIEGSLMRIADLPDRIGQADDVVWEARGDDAFLSSHRILSADPSNDFVSRTIANCLYRRGRMVEEWVVRDSLAIALQLGLDPDGWPAEGLRGYVGSFAERRGANVIAEGVSGPRDVRRGRDGAGVNHRCWNERDLERSDSGQTSPAHRGLPDRHRPGGVPPIPLSLLGPSAGAGSRWSEIATNHPERYADCGCRDVEVTVVYNGFPAYGNNGVRSSARGVQS